MKIEAEKIYTLTDDTYSLIFNQGVKRYGSLVRRDTYYTKWCEDIVPTSTKIEDTIVPLIDISNVNRSGTLYFDKHAEFPRFQLDSSDFKRCIKVDKADYIVLETNQFNSNNIFTREGYLFSMNQQYLFIHKEDLDYYKTNIDKFIPKFQSFVSNFNWAEGNYWKTEFQSVKLIYSGTLVFYLAKDECLIKYYKGEYNKPFILTEDLISMINDSLPIPTKEELISIQDMLASPDDDTVRLGIKILSSYDVEKWKLSILTLLIFNDRWLNLGIQNTVTTKKLVKSLDFRYTYTVENTEWFSKYSRLSWYDDVSKDTSQDDRDFCKEIITSTYVDYLNNVWSRYAGDKFDIRPDVEIKAK